MGLVDLRGRTDEPPVRALATLAGLAEADDVALVGWSEEDVLVGLAGVERLDEDEVRLRAVFVAEPSRRRGIGRRLVDAVVAGAPAERFVAGGDDDGAGFLARCGFHASANGLWVREVAARPASAGAVHAVTLAELESAIRASWDRDTSADPNEWALENPARGQCDATAVIVRSYVGGDILIADVLRDGKRVERHAWNRLPSGLAVDLTRDQFRGGEALAEPVVQEPLALGDAPRRHALLAERVAAALGAATP